MYHGALGWRDITARGRQASLVWGYAPAATLTEWTITRTERNVETDSPREWRVSGTLGPAPNDFALRQRPLLLTVPHKLGFWTFPVRRLTVTDSRLVATLGPPEQG